MWNFVSSIQATLDEAAGIDTRGDKTQATTTSSDAAPANTGWDNDEEDFELDYGDEEHRNTEVVDDGSLLVPGAAAVSSQPDRTPAAPSASPNEEDTIDSLQQVTTPEERSIASPLSSRVERDALRNSEDQNTEKDENVQQESPITNDLAAHSKAPANFEDSHVLASHSERHIETDNALLPQLLRLQAQLAEEATLRATAEEKLQKAISLKQKMDEKLRQVQQQHSDSLAGAKKGSVQMEATVAALQQEGQTMAKQLGEERSKVKELQNHLKEHEKQIETLKTSLSKKDEELLNVQRQLQEQITLAKTTKKEMSTIASAASQHEEALSALQEENERLQRVVEHLKAAAADEINEASVKEQELTASFEQQRDALMAEVEGLRLQLRRLALDHERSLVAMEKEVAAANERAYGSDLRAMEAARSSTDSTREMSAELIALNDHTAKLQEQLREKTQQLLHTQNHMREERDAMLAAHRAEVEGLRAQLQANTSHQTDAVLKLQVATEEMRREREGWRRREQGLNDSIQELRAAVKASALITPFHPPNASAPDVFAVGDSITSRVADSVLTSSVIAKSSVATAPAATFHYQPAKHHQPHASRVVEKELARVSTELAALQAEHQRLVAVHNSLSREHEVLLEMYGEKEEEIAALLEANDAKQVPTDNI